MATEAYATQVCVEVLCSDAANPQPAHTTQVLVEVLGSVGVSGSVGRMTQELVEVLCAVSAGGPPGQPPGEPCGWDAIAVNTETTNDSGQTLDLRLEWSVEEILGAVVDRFRAESGHLRTSLRYRFLRRRWRVHTGNLTNAERATLLSFWATHKAERSFTWTPPLAIEPIKARLADDALGRALRAPGVTAAEFNVEELRGGAEGLASSMVLWDVDGVYRSGNQNKDSSATPPANHYIVQAGRVANCFTRRADDVDGGGDYKRCFPVSANYYDEGPTVHAGDAITGSTLTIEYEGVYSNNSAASQGVAWCMDANGDILANAGTPGTGTGSNPTDRILWLNGALPAITGSGLRLTMTVTANFTAPDEQSWSGEMNAHPSGGGAPTVTTWGPVSRSYDFTEDVVLGLRFGKQGSITGTSVVEINRCLVTLVR